MANRFFDPGVQKASVQTDLLNPLKEMGALLGRMKSFPSASASANKIAEEKVLQLISEITKKLNLKTQVSSETNTSSAPDFNLKNDNNRFITNKLNLKTQAAGTPDNSPPDDSDRSNENVGVYQKN